MRFQRLLLTTILSTCVVGPAQADKVFAHSKSLGMSFIALGDPWCRPQVRMQVTGEDATRFVSQDYLDILQKLGHVLVRECAEADSMLITGEAGGDQVWRGQAERANGWLAQQQLVVPAESSPSSRAETARPAPMSPVPQPPTVAEVPSQPKSQIGATPDVTSAPVLPQADKDTSGSVWVWLVLLLIPVAGAVWWFVQRKPRKRISAGTQEADSPPAAQQVSPGYGDEVLLEPEQEDEPTGVADISTYRSVDSDSDDLLSVQRAKYQARLAETMDRLTQLQIKHQQLLAELSGIQKALEKFGDDLASRTRKALVVHFGGTKNALFRALSLSIVWRGFKRLPIGFKVVVAGVMLWGLYRLYSQYSLYASSNYSSYFYREVMETAWVIVAFYIVALPLLFLYERRAMVVGGYKTMKAHAANLKKIELWHVYTGQGHQDEAYAAMSLSTSKNPGLKEDRQIRVSDDMTDRDLAGRGLLQVMNDQLICSYSLSGKHKSGGLQWWDDTNEFMKHYGRVLVDTLAESEQQIGEEYGKLSRIAESSWKIRSLEADIPRIERLVANVETLEEIWRSISVSDEVFDFLLKRIDLFNMGDRAAPPGILLYGYPGNGKRFLAQMIAKSINGNFAEITASDIRSADDVKEIWAKYRSTPSTLMFIDHAEHIFAKPGSEHADGASKEIAMAWADEWSRIDPAQQRLWVVLSAQNEQDMHPSILARLGSSRIEIKSPDEKGRRLVLQQACGEHDVKGRLPEDVVRNSNGASVRELRDIVAEVRLQSYPEAPNPEQWKQAIINIRGGDASIKDETKTWDRLILPAAIKEQLKTMTNILVQAERFKEKGVEAPKGLLLYGPPGTGKTEIARTLANESGLQFIAASTAQMKGQYLGQSGQMVREVFARARASAPCILFIDEIESLAANRSSGDADSFTKEIVTQMLQEMDGVQKNERHVFVLAATNIPDAIDSAILSRFRNKIEIPLPDVEGRREILRVMLESRIAEPAFDVDEAAIKLARVLKNKSGRDLKNFIDRALEREVMRAGSPDDINLTVESLMEEAITMQGDNAFKDATKTWDRLILSAEIKTQLQSITRILIDSEKFQEKGVEAPKGMLLYGPPGTGKTEIARTLANESGLEFMSASTADMKAGYVGQSGQLVKQVFANARANAPCILFIDEIESIAAKRGSALADQFTQEIVTQMLQEMDGVQRKGGRDAHVFVLAATNIPEAIDDAINSRFTARVEIPLPDEDGRREILKGMLRSRIPDAGFDIDEAAAKLARVLKGKSGRDLKNFINRALEREALRAGSPDDINLTLEGLLEEARPKGKEVSDEELARIWSRIVLPDAVKSSVMNKIRMFNRADPAAPRGLLLYGPPGTGKTEIARKIADSASCHFMSLSIPDLKAGHIGGSGERVRKVWEEARGRGRAVIFVDECEGMFARRGSTDSDSASNELVQAFLAEWDGVGSSGQVWVVGATNRRDLLDEAIVSRFGAAVEIGLPDAAGRQRILELEMEKLGREPDVPAHIGKATNGLSGRNLATLARDICTLAAEKGEVTEADWGAVLAQQSSAGSDKVSDDAHWDSLVIDDDTLDKLKTVCGMLQHIETLQQQGVKPPRGMLLYGPPGTGKTQIARTLANESGVQFIAAATADLKAGYVGQSGQKVKEIFERARSRAPSILFIDEMESVAPSRNSAGSDQFTQEIVTQMLQELDGVKARDAHVFLLAATNIPDAIDSAILSRLPEKVEIPLPGLPERERLFRLFLKSIKHTDFDMETAPRMLAERYSGVSGRDIRGILDAAQQTAVRRALQQGAPDKVILTMEDLGISAVEAGQANS